MASWPVRERLVNRDPDTGQPSGLLAEKWEQKAPDTWRFFLRKGIKFHNGEAFNAESVAFDINRHVTRNDKILAYVSTLKEAKVVDEYTVDIVAAQADPILPLRMYLAPMFPKQWTQDNTELAPIQMVGTGPYKFVEWVKGQYIRITANPDYWGPPPNIKVLLSSENDTLRVQ